MQQVLRQSLDPDAARWFDVIDRFDSAVAASASAEALVRLAADITRRPTGVRDEWSGLHIGVARGSLVDAEELFGREITSVLFGMRQRSRDAARVALNKGSALAVPIEVGAGRVGVTWTLGATRTRWRPLDYLVTERLATAIGARAVATRNRVSAEVQATAVVEKLLTGDLPEEERARTARAAKLALDGAYVAIAVEQSPPNAVSLEALGAIAERALTRRGAVARAGVIGRTAGLVASASAATPTSLAAIGEAATGFDVRVGVGDNAGLGELARSWEQAKECLALGSLVNQGDSQAVFFKDLGVLHLLAQIPTTEVLDSKLFHALNDSLAHRGSPSDIDVLEAYLEEGTLRRTAARVFLHHTTVEHRLKRIEEKLGLDLRQPTARFQAQLLLKLQRIVRLEDASRT
ncbi:MAG: PucR family transcriptional regulator [Gaiellaceae bacterium]